MGTHVAYKKGMSLIRASSNRLTRDATSALHAVQATGVLFGRVSVTVGGRSGGCGVCCKRTCANGRAILRVSSVDCAMNSIAPNDTWAEQDGKMTGKIERHSIIGMQIERHI